MVKFADNSLPYLNEGEYSVVLSGVIWLGMQAQNPKDAEKYGPKPPTSRLKLVLEFPTQTDKDGKTLLQGKTIKNVTTNERGAFIKLASALLGKKLKSTDLALYLRNPRPFEELLGKQLTSVVAHFATDEGLKAYIEDIKQPHPKDDPVKGVQDFVYFDPYNGDVDVFKTLTYYTKKEVMSAVDSKEFPAALHKQWVKDQEDHAKDNGESKGGSHSALA